MPWCASATWGRPWHYGPVQAIFKQPAYTGRAYYNRSRTCHGTIGRRRKIGRGLCTTPSPEPRPREEWIEMDVPPLVGEDTWRRAQERLVEKERFPRRNNKRNFYLLRGLLLSGQCRRTLGRGSCGIHLLRRETEAGDTRAGPSRTVARRCQAGRLRPRLHSALQGQRVGGHIASLHGRGLSHLFEGAAQRERRAREEGQTVCIVLTRWKLLTEQSHKVLSHDRL